MNEVAADDHPADLTRAAPISYNLASRNSRPAVLVDIAVAAEALDGVERGRVAASAAKRIAPAASRLVIWPRSHACAAEYTYARAAPSRVYMSATLP